MGRDEPRCSVGASAIMRDDASYTARWVLDRPLARAAVGSRVPTESRSRNQSLTTDAMMTDEHVVWVVDSFDLE
jgi:hypothetical protein